MFFAAYSCAVETTLDEDDNWVEAARAAASAAV
jgi:hypothetical protein